MQSLSLIYPMSTLIFLTFSMMYLLLVLRVQAVRSRKVSPRYFKLNKGDDVPDNMLAVSQNYSNLFELPALFYLVCVIAIIINQSAEYFIIHAWAFVLFRYIHSYIHVSYNHILHRLAAFALSGFILLSMWIKLVLIVIAMD